ncbi:MAG: ferrochelatase [Robiginitomaculum sp.]|nr:MAG: ferrochelatase [Robiginitomaculum sp.]
MSTKIGILLVNLGSPAAPTPKATRKYLAQFLRDRRVIELTPWLWWPILYGVVLRTRPSRSAKAYEEIWRKEENGKFARYSALIETTFAQADALQDRLPKHVIVKAAMRYGAPSIKAGMIELRDAKCTKIIIMPLYPQYAGATTESVYDEVARVHKKIANLPPVELTRNYYEHPRYISAIADSLKTHLKALDWQADKILVSFHGLPKSSIEKGDPYESECERSYGLILQKLPKLCHKMKLTFQSRFGPKEWLGPYTVEVLRDMARSGQKNVVIITPGFAADCLETLEELSLKAKQGFLADGGEQLSLVPCLNADKAHIDLLEVLVRDKLSLEG